MRFLLSVECMDENAAGTSASTPGLRAAGCAILLPSSSAAPLAIVLEHFDVPSSITVRMPEPRRFTRLRRGALAYGLPESFAEEAGDGFPDSRDLVVAESGHYEADFDRATLLFGSIDTLAYLPRSGGGGFHDTVSIPVSSPIEPTRAVFRLARAGRLVRYELVGCVPDDVWICPICGRACEAQEPHTAAHGAPGHLRAGRRDGPLANDTQPIPTRVDDPNSPAFVQRHRQLAAQIDQFGAGMR
jgi:hypothetical protein